MRNLTIGIFALAAVVLGFSFWLLTRGDDDNGLQTNPTSTDTVTAVSTTTPGTTTPGGNGTPGATTTGTTTPGTGTPGTGDPGTYVVVAGDSCSSIAESNGITLDEFLEANPEIDADCLNLIVDQEVVIP